MLFIFLYYSVLILTSVDRNPTEKGFYLELLLIYHLIGKTVTSPYTIESSLSQAIDD